MEKETCNEPRASVPSYPSTRSRTLYLILQGEFVLYCDQTTKPHTLRILAPDVDGHSYLAGPWLNNSELPSERLELCGVRGGNVNPEDLNDTFLKLGVGSVPDFASARVDISAPLPLAILMGLMDITSSVVITTWHKETGTPIHPSVCGNPTVIPVLVYKWFEGEEPPFIATVSGGARWEAGGSEVFKSIHVYATSPKEENSAHSKLAFQAAAKLLGRPARIDWLEPTEGSGAPTSSRTVETYPGLSWAQVNLFLWQHHIYTPEQLMSDQEPYKPHGVAVGSGNCGPITM